MRHGSGDMLGRWEDVRWLNTPGPLYCGDRDNCGTGPLNAPNNVFVDADGYEFIFRRPTNLYELHQVLKAAWADPLDGYAADGNAHWTYDTIKAWWQRRSDIEAEISRRIATLINHTFLGEYAERACLERWRDYLREGMREYLRIYAYFLEHSHVPEAVATLPDP